MIITFKEAHLKDALLRDTVLNLHARFEKIGETQFDVPTETFSGRQLSLMARAGVEMAGDMPLFLKTTEAFLGRRHSSYLDEENTEAIITQGGYLTSDMRHTLQDGWVLQLMRPAAPGGNHLSATDLLPYLDHGQLLNLHEYGQFVEHGDIQHTVTSINDEWEKHFTDYKQARRKMQDLVLEIGFENLTREEQRICCTWFATSKTNMDTVLTPAEQEFYGVAFDTQSKASRRKRYSAAFTAFLTSLGGIDSVKVMQALMKPDPMIGKDLEYLYVELGYEAKGTLNYKNFPDPMESVLDLVNSSPGTRYFNAGLKEMNLQPVNGLTADELILKAHNIIKHGIY